MKRTLLFCTLAGILSIGCVINVNNTNTGTPGEDQNVDPGVQDASPDALSTDVSEDASERDEQGDVPVSTCPEGLVRVGSEPLSLRSDIEFKRSFVFDGPAQSGWVANFLGGRSQTVFEDNKAGVIADNSSGGFGLRSVAEVPLGFTMEVQFSFTALAFAQRAEIRIGWGEHGGALEVLSEGAVLRSFGDNAGASTPLSAELVADTVYRMRLSEDNGGLLLSLLAEDDSVLGQQRLIGTFDGSDVLRVGAEAGGSTADNKAPAAFLHNVDVRDLDGVPTLSMFDAPAFRYNGEDFASDGIEYIFISRGDVGDVETTLLVLDEEPRAPFWLPSSPETVTSYFVSARPGEQPMRFVLYSDLSDADVIASLEHALDITSTIELSTVALTKQPDGSYASALEGCPSQAPE